MSLSNQQCLIPTMVQMSPFGFQMPGGQMASFSVPVNPHQQQQSFPIYSMNGGAPVMYCMPYAMPEGAYLPPLTFIRVRDSGTIALGNNSSGSEIL